MRLDPSTSKRLTRWVSRLPKLRYLVLADCCHLEDLTSHTIQHLRLMGLINGRLALPTLKTLEIGPQESLIELSEQTNLDQILLLGEAQASGTIRSLILSSGPDPTQLHLVSVMNMKLLVTGLRRLALLNICAAASAPLIFSRLQYLSVCDCGPHVLQGASFPVLTHVEVIYGRFNVWTQLKDALLTTVQAVLWMSSMQCKEEDLLFLQNASSLQHVLTIGWEHYPGLTVLHQSRPELFEAQERFKRLGTPTEIVPGLEPLTSAWNDCESDCGSD